MGRVHVLSGVLIYLWMYSGIPLIRTPSNEDTSINRTLFAVPNAMFVYNSTPEIRTPH